MGVWSVEHRRMGLEGKPPVRVAAENHPAQVFISALLKHSSDLRSTSPGTGPDRG